MKTILMMTLLVIIGSTQAFFTSPKLAVTCEQGALFARCAFENTTSRTLTCTAMVKATTVWGHKLEQRKVLKLESLESQTILITADHADPLVDISSKANCK